MESFAQETLTGRRLGLFGLTAACPLGFAFQLLSDSSLPEIAAAEEHHFAALKLHHPRAGFVHYRRRPANTGFKAGNLREFAERTDGVYDHMIVLDADSLMSAAAMLRLVRVMQANPSLGILQSLVTCPPAAYAFARTFQFYMVLTSRPTP